MRVTTFQRARSEEQREARRAAILQTTTAMLSEMPVAAVTLNELSRRVGLAKSNVLRYFESREAILLELLVQLAEEFFVETSKQLRLNVNLNDSARGRAAEVAAVLATTLEARPMLCELMSAQAGVLEHNVSAETVERYKRAGYQSLAAFVGVLRQVLPELDVEEAAEATRAMVTLAGALWTHSHPPDAVRDVCLADPTLAFLPDGFARSVERMVGLILLGLLAEHSEW